MKRVMKAWGIKGPYGLIEVHGDEGRAMRSAVLHKIYNGWDVKVVDVEVREAKEDTDIRKGIRRSRRGAERSKKYAERERSEKMNNDERIARLKELLVVFKDEIIEHARIEHNPNTAFITVEYHRGWYEGLASVIKRIESVLGL